MIPKSRLRIFHRTTLAAASLLASSALATPPPADIALEQGFRSPPDRARPIVWWHWMNGAIDPEGVRLDLDWMRRIGVSGVQQVEAGLDAPQAAPHRVTYLSPQWRSAFHATAARAQALGLELGISGSPGWSETGGPWVTPGQAMRKLVWTRMFVVGGAPVDLVLPQPPGIAGPFQGVAMAEVATGPPPAPIRDYADVAVIAYRLPPDAPPTPRPQVTASAGRLDPEALGDESLSTPQFLPWSNRRGEAWIQFAYAAPVVARSVSLGLAAPTGFGAPPAAAAVLSASADGAIFRKVADLPPTTAPERTVSFAPTTARYFRLELKLIGEGGAPPGDRGAVPLRLPEPAPIYRISRLTLDPVARVNRFEEKAGFAAALDYDALATPEAPAEEAVRPGEVIDLTRAMTSDGRLRWTPPPGRWAVLRLGSSSTGHLNGPAPPEATGLEVDKLDAGKVGAYLDTYLAPYASAAGPHLFGAAGVRALLNDSIEAGPQNWTDAMLADFQRLRGYDPRPWLPTLTGVIVGDAASSDRFLWDWRRTLAELLAENHYGQIARSAHARGLIVYGEALEDHRPQLGDDLEMRRYTDVPMGAMWWIPPDEAPRATFVADDRGAASVGHIYGQPVIAAESLTAFGRPWDFAPRDLKRTVDLEFALGINRIVIHTSTHEPQSAGKPGLALAPFLGQYFTRNETWAEQARPWIDYLARSAFLLQQGRFVADVAYFYGEEAPLTAQFGDHPPADAPRGYGWDFVNADVILHRLSIDKGALTTATGMRYRVLYLGAGARRMTLPVLRKLSDLVDAGAVLVGPAPIDSPSLADDPQAFGALVARLWTPDAARSEGAVHGQGRVFARGDANAALSELGVAPDVVFHGESAGAELMGLHRRAADADLYFITNQKARPEWVRVLLRTSGKAAELWRAEDGSRVAATYRPEGDRTAVDLDLGPQDAVFVVLRGKASPGAHAAPRRTEQTLAALTQGWRLSFEPGRGAPSGEAPARLGAWTESPAAGVRYFSGTARYATTFTLPKGRRGRGARLALDLGDVRDLAEVRVDGRPVGIAWKPPYRLALSPALKPGRHRLEVRVTNPWRNRLIGDAQPGATRIARTTGPTWSADAPLRPAGLLGPVRILVSTPTR